MKLKRTTIAVSAAALALVAVVIIVFATTAPIGGQGAVPSPESLPIAENPKYVWPYDSEPTYTQEQYDLLISSLKFEGYKQMSIAEFNRKLNAVFSNQEDDGDAGEKLGCAYEMVLAALPETDPNAGFLLNTVQASREEYNARMEEVYSGRQLDPSFAGRAASFREEDVYGETYRTDYAQADFRFTYRILDQDALTVAARDQFLQAVLSGAQAYLDSRTPGQLIDDPDGEGSFRTALEAAGKAASNTNIEFINCEVDYYDDYR